MSLEFQGHNYVIKEKKMIKDFKICMYLINKNLKERFFLMNIYGIWLILIHKFIFHKLN